MMINNKLQTAYNFLKEEYNVAYKEWKGKPIVLFWHKGSNKGNVFYIKTTNSGIDEGFEDYTNTVRDYLDYGVVVCGENGVWLSDLDGPQYAINTRDEVLELAKIIEKSVNRRFPDIKAAVEAYRMQE